jgi:hypothetical protein
MIQKILMAKHGLLLFLQIYPDAAHSLMAVRPHLYLSMEQFFGSCFHEVADIKVAAFKTKKTGR